MNKFELISAVAARAGITKKEAERIVSVLLDVIMENVANGEEIRIVGFGTFECRNRKERTGSNPRTREKIKIAATQIPAFKPGKAFKEAVSGK